MEWYHVLSIFFGNAAIVLPLWLWSRSEAIADRRESIADRREGSAERRDILNVIKSLQEEMRNEIKDFHGRLCTIEERNKNKG